MSELKQEIQGAENFKNELLEFLPYAELEQKISILNKIIDSQPLLNKLGKDSCFFEKILNILLKDLSIDHDLIQKILSVLPEDAQIKMAINSSEGIITPIARFFDTNSSEYSDKDFGIDISALVLAAKAKNREKDSEKNSTLQLVVDLEDFHTLLIELKEAKEKENFPLLFRLHCLVVGRHWIFFDLQISENCLELIVFDSLGYKQNETNSDTLMVIEKFNEIFSNESKNIYVSAKFRQKDFISCRIFALDDFIHSYAIEKYLPEGDLFDFCKGNKLPELNKTGDSFTYVKLPPSVYRTTQGLSEPKNEDPSYHNTGIRFFVDNYLSESQKISRINKKGETIETSIEKHIGGGRNNRLSYKFSRMKDLVFNYISENDPQVLEDEKNRFLLPSFVTSLKDGSLTDLKITTFKK